MKVVDANVLLYAVNSASAHHESSRRWLDGALAGEDSVGFTWLVACAFLRLSTSASVFPHPLSIDEAAEQLDSWTASPDARWLNPTGAHLGVLGRLLAETGGAGNLVNDAHLAGIAVEHRATVVSWDNDFTRFAGVRWATPDALLGSELT